MGARAPRRLDFLIQNSCRVRLRALQSSYRKLYGEKNAAPICYFIAIERERVRRAHAAYANRHVHRFARAAGNDGAGWRNGLAIGFWTGASDA